MRACVSNHTSSVSMNIGTWQLIGKPAPRRSKQKAGLTVSFPISRSNKNGSRQVHLSKRYRCPPFISRFLSSFLTWNTRITKKRKSDLIIKPNNTRIHKERGISLDTQHSPEFSGTLPMRKQDNSERINLPWPFFVCVILFDHTAWKPACPRCSWSDASSGWSQLTQYTYRQQTPLQIRVEKYMPYIHLDGFSFPYSLTFLVFHSSTPLLPPWLLRPNVFYPET